MYVLTIRNVHEALPAALHFLGVNGVDRESRNGPVRMFPMPFTTHYKSPCERVLFWPKRDANPFFHLFEALWMLGGRNDVKYLQQFVKTFGRYSDDGEVLHGAYGHRWRKAFGWDQLKLVAERLRANKDDRRQVVQMYDAVLDGTTQEGRKDIPCNLTITLQVNVLGALDMLVLNRSNDLIWGCYGANAVHFSVLQEYMAAWIGVPVGGYWQTSANLHAYHETLKPIAFLPLEAQEQGRPSSPYENGAVKVYPLVQSIDRFNGELPVFLDVGYGVMGYQEPFFRKTAIPMLRAHAALQSDHRDRFRIAFKELESMPEDSDWRLAARDWIARRQGAAQRKEQA